MKLLSFLFLGLLFSCAGWRVENTPHLGEYPRDLKVEEKIKLKLNFSKYDHIYNGELKKSSISDTKKIEMIEEIKQAYIESGIFVFDEKNPDVTADIQIKSEGEGSLNRAILTYATLFLVPSSSQTTYTVTTEFKKKDGHVLGTIVKSDTVEKWQQLFLIFAMPFKYPHSALKSTLVDLNRATIVEAHRDDYFREVTE